MDRDTIVFTALALGLFFSSMLLGTRFSSEIIDIIREVMGFGGLGEGPLTIEMKLFLFAYIFARNSIVTTLNVALGPLLGLFPIITIFFNGFLIGGVGVAIMEEKGLEYVILGLAPHGIVEIPAFIYSAVLGFKLAKQVISQGFRGGGVSRIYIESLKLYIRRVIPLLIIAAFIESFITTYLLGL